jgi:hypothetical protein
MPPIAAFATEGEGGEGARSIGVSPGIGPLGMVVGGALASVLEDGGPEANGLVPAHAATAMPASATVTILDSIDVPRLIRRSLPACTPPHGGEPEQQEE